MTVYRDLLATNVIFPFSASYFPILDMACKRVNCAEGLTRLALKNNLRCVQRFLCRWIARCRWRFSSPSHALPFRVPSSTTWTCLRRKLTLESTLSKEHHTTNVYRLLRWLHPDNIQRSGGSMQFTHSTLWYYIAIGSAVRLSGWSSNHASSIPSRRQSGTSVDFTSCMTRITTSSCAHNIPSNQPTFSRFWSPSHITIMSPMFWTRSPSMDNFPVRDTST